MTDRLKSKVITAFRQRTSTLLIGLMLAVVLIVSGCSSSNDDASSNRADSGSASNASSEQMKVAATSSESADRAESDMAMGNSNADQSSELAKSDDTAVPQTAGGLGEPAGMNRKLIYKADLAMETDKFVADQAAIRSLIEQSGGYLISFTDNKTEQEQAAYFVIKVPADGFTSFIQRVEQLKPVDLQQSIQGSDVTEEYVDLDARLNAKLVTEARLLAFMDKATKATDLVAFSNQLGQVQEEIELLKGRMRYIDQNVSFSTIKLRLYESLLAIADKKAEARPALWQGAADAAGSSIHVLGQTGRGLIIFAAGAIPILIVLGIIAVIVYVLWKRRKQSKPTNTELL